MSFKRYTWELLDRSKASLLPLETRVVRSEVVEALSYGCARWNPLKGHYTKLRHRMLLRILGAWLKSPNKRILSYKDALQRTECESIETTVCTRRLLWSGRGRCSAWVTTGTQECHAGRAEEREKTWAEGKEK